MSPAQGDGGGETVLLTTQPLRSQDILDESKKCARLIKIESLARGSEVNDLRSYLVGRHADELLDFWQGVERLKENAEGRARDSEDDDRDAMLARHTALSRELVDEFLTVGGRREVNISDRARHRAQCAASLAESSSAGDSCAPRAVLCFGSCSGVIYNEACERQAAGFNAAQAEIATILELDHVVPFLQQKVAAQQKLKVENNGNANNSEHVGSKRESSGMRGVRKVASKVTGVSGCFSGRQS